MIFCTKKKKKNPYHERQKMVWENRKHFVHLLYSLVLLCRYFLSCAHHLDGVAYYQLTYFQHYFISFHFLVSINYVAPRRRVFYFVLVENRYCLWFPITWLFKKINYAGFVSLLSFLPKSHHNENHENHVTVSLIVVHNEGIVSVKNDFTAPSVFFNHGHNHLTHFHGSFLNFCF